MHTPTQVLVGDRDNPCCPRLAMLIAKQVPGARLTPIAGADHLINLSQPQSFDRELAAFLDRVGGA
jgi:pimeloyl-ACP methyl ester carboxylesterase